MLSLIEKILKRGETNHSYTIDQYKPSRARAMSKPERATEYDVESPAIKDEMEIDNIYKDS